MGKDKNQGSLQETPLITATTRAKRARYNVYKDKMPLWSKKGDINGKDEDEKAREFRSGREKTEETL